MELIETLYGIGDVLDEKFPMGNTPLQAIARLCEESGELAKEVNHREGMGIKEQKHGAPDTAHLAKEIQDVMVCALQLAKYYGVQEEVEESIRSRYQSYFS